MQAAAAAFVPCPASLVVRCSSPTALLHVTPPRDGLARSVVGTPYYMSPELLTKQAYGAGSDVWALGVTAFELMALRKPFVANTAERRASSLRILPWTCPRHRRLRRMC